MNKFLRSVGVLVLAAALVAGGYIVGQKNQLSSITSALPRETVESTAMPSDKPQEAPKKPAEAVQTEKNIIEKTPETTIQRGMSEVENAEITVGNNSGAVVKLYTSAEFDGEEFIWDDRNQWILEVNMNGDYYTLINKYVQLGKVDVMVATDEKGECEIIAVVSTGTGLVVEKYTYNGTAFEGQTVYNSGVLNVWGTTF